MPDTVKQDILAKQANLDMYVSILQSLPLGIVVFDNQLQIQDANSYAHNCLEIQPTIDASLLAGTNENIWGNWQSLAEVLKTGKVRHFDNVSYRRGDKQILLEITCSPLHSPSDHAIIGGLLVIQNITEKASLQKQVAHNERLAALGKLASKVAHELNNPMDGVLRYINLAKRIISEQGPSKPLEYLENASDGLKRMVGIITELLEFSRTRHSSVEDMPIDKIIDEAVKFIEPSAAACSVEIERRYATALPKIKGGNLFQVFCNLLKNAVEAMPDGGKIFISCDIEPDNIAVIKFRDTGKGIDPAAGDAIFEPFFSTKTTGKSTGLGLAICRDIVEKYGGKITAQNAPDAGSIFTVCLPIT